MRARHATQVRQREIIEAARKIIAEHGAESLTTKVLAGAVGVTEGAIYRHFDSKKSILLGLIGEIEETLFECIDKALSEEVSPLARLENVLREHLSYTERRRGVSFLILSEVLRNGHRQLQRQTQALIERYLSTIESILREGVEAGEINPDISVRTAAILFFGQIQGAVTLWRFVDPEASLSERHHSLWQLYRQAVLNIHESSKD